MTPFSERTQEEPQPVDKRNMYSDSDLRSALQKFIRRGRHNDVVAVANEMFDRMLPENFGLFERFWRRLFVIASEDIGVAQTGTIRFLAACQRPALRHFTEGETERAREICLRAVLTLSKSPKSRLTDNAYMLLSRMHRPSLVCFENLYASVESKHEFTLLSLVVSIHRQRRRRSVPVKPRHLFEAVRLSILENDDDLREELESIWGAYAADGCVLYLMHMALLICRPPGDACEPADDGPPSTIPPLPPELPDFVYDKHTSRGRELGRGLRHFLEEGSLLVGCSIPDPYYPLLLKDLRDGE